jgi:alanine racemase
VKKGESVGYQREYIAEGDVTIGIIPLGYADGLRRSLGNGVGKIWIQNRLVPIIGNVCMDMCMVDITDLDVEEGDDIVVFGNEYSLEQLASDAGTIPYEILTSIPQRVKRVYYQE